MHTSCVHIPYTLCRADEKAAFSEYQVSHSESALIKLSLEEEQRKKRDLLWVLHYFPSQISSCSLPKLLFVVLDDKFRITIINDRINSL